MRPKGMRVACGCVMEHHLSFGQSNFRAFLHGLTFGAFPVDYREREKRESDERLMHILQVHG